MSLSCECGDDYEWFFRDPEDYAPLATKRSRKCCSCREKIAVGKTAMMFPCWRYPKDAIEEKIWGYDGSEVPMAPKFMCERCADLFLSLQELGFCMTLGDDMRGLVKEYAEEYGPVRRSGPG